MTFGELVRDWREHVRVPLREVAKRTGLSISYLSEIERSQRHPRIGCALSIMKALDIPFEELRLITNQEKGFCYESASSPEERRD